jgi:hypothetical protein
MEKIESPSVETFRTLLNDALDLKNQANQLQKEANKVAMMSIEKAKEAYKALPENYDPEDWTQINKNTLARWSRLDETTGHIEFINFQ